MTSKHRDAAYSLFSVARKSLLLFCGLSLLVSSAVAQDNETAFQGVWDFTSTSGDSYVLILKRNGLASYFRSDNQDRTVYQGSWEKSADRAVATWPDSTTFTLTVDPQGYRVIGSGPNTANNFQAIVSRIPDEVLGQWAKTPVDEDAVKSDLDEAKGYFGTWKIGEDAPFYVIVESDRSAASSWSGSKHGARGLRGAWARQGSELHIIWDSGHYSILRETERGYAYKRVEPGEVIEDDTSIETATTRVKEEVIPSTWLSRYTEERDDYTGGIVFTSRKEARAFYRGYWLVQYEETAYERFEIGRFGGLTTSRNADLEGNWRMSGQDLYLRWDDGMRKILSPVGGGFVLYHYRPGRPLDGVPTRILPTAPEDSEKLAEYVNSRKDVARMLAENAIAAGIDPRSGYGWGQSFMRWAWPFGAEDSAENTDALIVDAFEAPNQNDPWWWPIWSERPTTTETSASSSEAESAKPASTAQTSKPIEDSEKSSNNWYWPF